MRITFVLPGAVTVPGGGPKIVYEYANHLVRIGYYVSVVHPSYLTSELQPIKRLIRRHIVSYVTNKVRGSWKPLWFPVD